MTFNVVSSNSQFFVNCQNIAKLFLIKISTKKVFHLFATFKLTFYYWAITEEIFSPFESDNNEIQSSIVKTLSHYLYYNDEILMSFYWLLIAEILVIFVPQIMTFWWHGCIHLFCNILFYWKMVSMNALTYVMSLLLQSKIVCRSRKIGNYPIFIQFYFRERKTCADPEVRHSNTEESILYFIRRKYNIFWALSLILSYV